MPHDPPGRITDAPLFLVPRMLDALRTLACRTETGRPAGPLARTGAPWGRAGPAGRAAARRHRCAPHAVIDRTL